MVGKIIDLSIPALEALFFPNCTLEICRDQICENKNRYSILILLNEEIWSVLYGIPRVIPCLSAAKV